MEKIIDLMGQRFGRLVVIGITNKRSHGKVFWECKCDCGNIVIVNGSNLRYGSTKSCGCLQKEKSSERNLGDGISAKNSLYGQYKRNASRRGLIFNLTKEYFLYLTQQNCFYCGKEPSYITRYPNSKGNYIYNGIDRIDSSLGYIDDNVVSCCGDCNEMKMARSQREFLDHIEKIHNYQKEKTNGN